MKLICKIFFILAFILISNKVNAQDGIFLSIEIDLSHCYGCNNVINFETEHGKKNKKDSVYLFFGQNRKNPRKNKFRKEEVKYISKESFNLIYEKLLNLNQKGIIGESHFMLDGYDLKIQFGRSSANIIEYDIWQFTKENPLHEWLIFTLEEVGIKKEDFF